MRSLLIILLLVSVCAQTYGQRRGYKFRGHNYRSLGTDFGVSLGGSKYFGDIGETDALYSPRDFRQTRWSTGVHYRWQFHKHMAVQGAANYFRLQGADSLLDDPNRFTRNLSFINDVIEFAGEYQFVWSFHKARQRYNPVQFDRKAYFTIGIAAFRNNPRAKLPGESRFRPLRPLNTEGPQNAYNAWNVAIPIGVGYDYVFNQKHRVGLFVKYRITFTDYLDDVSTVYPSPSALSAEAAPYSNRTQEVLDTPQAQSVAAGGGAPLYLFYKEGGIRGNPDNLDYYMTFGITYSWFRSKGSRKSF